MEVWRGLFLVWLMVLCTEGARRREKRTLGWLFSSEEPKKQLPIYRVHHYTGIHLQPLVPGQNQASYVGGDVPEVEGETPPDVLDLPEGESDSYDDEGGTLGGLASLLPYSGGLLNGALGLSGGSSSGGRDLRRIGKTAKKDLLLSFKGKKVELVSNIASGAVNKLISTAQAKKNFVKGILKGNAKTSPFSGGIYRYVPVIYPRKPGLLSKIPFVGKFLGYGSPIEVPQVYLPDLPQLVSLPSPPNLPHITLPSNYEFPFKTGYYVKVKVPKIGKYDIPGTSYGVPESLVPVPDYVPPAPPTFPDEEDNEVLPPTTYEPEVPSPNYPYPPEVPSTSFPYPPEEPAQSFPYPPEVPAQSLPYPTEVPAQSFPYPPEVPSPSFPYPPEVPAPSFPYPAETPEYIPPPPPLPDLPEDQFNLLPYPPVPQGFQYPPSVYYETAGSEKHEVVVKPGKDVRPVYRHKEEDTQSEQRSTEPVHVIVALEVPEHQQEIKEVKEDISEESTKDVTEKN